MQVLGTPEVARVYIGSFWDQPLRYDINRRLFEAEEQVTTGLVPQIDPSVPQPVFTITKKAPTMLNGR